MKPCKTCAHWKSDYVTYSTEKQMICYLRFYDRDDNGGYSRTGRTKAAYCIYDEFLQPLYEPAETNQHADLLEKELKNNAEYRKKLEKLEIDNRELKDRITRIGNV